MTVVLCQSVNTMGLSWIVTVSSRFVSTTYECRIYNELYTYRIGIYARPFNTYNV